MVSKPDQTPQGEQEVKGATPKNQGELAPQLKARGPKSPHCGDMGLASRERQFRPGSGGR